MYNSFVSLRNPLITRTLPLYTRNAETKTLMMKRKNAFALFFVLLATALAPLGCKRKEEPVTELYGKVCLINSNTPVPNALVRFLVEESGGSIWSPTGYTEVGNDTTDADGNFTVPRGTVADLVRAYGLQSIYDVESQDVYIEQLWETGGDIRLSLIPPAWLKVQAIDIEPLNPEVVAVQGDTAIGLFPGGEIIISEGYRKWKVRGNMAQDIYYRLVYDDIVFGNSLQYNIPPPTPFDTTEITITY